MYKPPEVLPGAFEDRITWVRPRIVNATLLGHVGICLTDQFLKFLLRQNPKHLYTNLALLTRSDRSDYFSSRLMQLDHRECLNGILRVGKPCSDCVTGFQDDSVLHWYPSFISKMW